MPEVRRWGPDPGIVHMQVGLYKAIYPTMLKIEKELMKPLPTLDPKAVRRIKESSDAEILEASKFVEDNKDAILQEHGHEALEAIQKLLTELRTKRKI